MRFLHTLLHPDREEQNPLSAEIAQAANILQVGEFQLLQLAYRDWHGAEMSASMTDRLFADYMLRKKTPHWARHYARRILDWEARGLLDADNPAYHRYDREYVTHVPQGIRRFVVAATVLTVAVGGVLWLSHVATDGGTKSFLPPYFDDGDLKTPPKRGGVGPGS